MAAFGAVFFMPSTAGAHHYNTPKKAREAKTVRPGCFENSTMKHYYRWAKHKYHVRKRPLTDGQALHVKHLALCLATRAKSDWAYDKKRQWRKAFRLRLAYYRLTPFTCSNGTRWAIPCYIVYCESHYSWSAYNPSGAVGPYQLLGWGAIYPARTFAQKLQNHRIARGLYLSQGSSPWVCA